MSATHLSATALRNALTLRDLTDPAQGPHAMQLIVDHIERALAGAWGVPVRRARAHPVVSIAENYDRLLVSGDAAAREARYTRYVNDDTVLRTHTSAMIPSLLEQVRDHDLVLSCPGVVYRRDVVDRTHVGEPHQLDLWRVRTGGPALSDADLLDMIGIVVGSALPGYEHRVVDASHPYTIGGLQIDVQTDRGWLEVGECGIAHPEVLSSAGLHGSSGLAMGLGLDRLVMIRKGIEDIRALRSRDERIARQMLDLEPYRPVSSQPPIVRDLSIMVGGDVDAETLGDRIRDALPDPSALEEVAILDETGYEDLPEQARARMGAAPGQKNLLVRLVLRHLERTLTADEATEIRDRVYDAIHQGSVREPSPSRTRR